MYLKKIKRKCGVRGCKSLEAFAVSKTREAGNSVIICLDCLKKALTEAEQYREPERKEKITNSAPNLFFNAALNDKEKIEYKENEDIETENKCICGRCGKEFATERGLKNHLKVCGER